MMLTNIKLRILKKPILWCLKFWGWRANKCSWQVFNSYYNTFFYDNLNFKVVLLQKGLVIITDLQGFTLNHLMARPLSIAKKQMLVLQARFPFKFFEMLTVFTY